MDKGVLNFKTDLFLQANSKMMSYMVKVNITAEMALNMRDNIEMDKWKARVLSSSQMVEYTPANGEATK